jgi:hypothetical protein
MKTKALKLPDGGTVDVLIPNEFGSPILALNDSMSYVRNNPVIVYSVGIALGILGAYIFVEMSK